MSIKKKTFKLKTFKKKTFFFSKHFPRLEKMEKSMENEKLCETMQKYYIKYTMKDMSNRPCNNCKLYSCRCTFRTIPLFEFTQHANEAFIHCKKLGLEK